MGRAYQPNGLAALDLKEKYLFKLLTQEKRNQQEEEIQKLKKENGKFKTNRKKNKELYKKKKEKRKHLRVLY